MKRRCSSFADGGGRQDRRVESTRRGSIRAGRRKRTKACGLCPTNCSPSSPPIARWRCARRSAMTRRRLSRGAACSLPEAVLSLRLRLLPGDRAENGRLRRQAPGLGDTPLGGKVDARHRDWSEQLPASPANSGTRSTTFDAETATEAVRPLRLAHRQRRA